MVLSAGQTHDSKGFCVVLDSIFVPKQGRGRPRKRPKSLIADKAYGGRPCREAARARGIAVMIPAKSDEIRARKAKGYKGGRPFRFDKEQYKKRNLIERLVNRLKHWRRIATRYEKRAQNYMGMVLLACILIWLPR